MVPPRELRPSCPIGTRRAGGGLCAYLAGMEARARRSHVVLLVVLCPSGAFGCGSDSPSAVERLERAPGAVVTISGTIDVGTQGEPGELPEMDIRFYDPPDTTMLEERQILWSPTYSIAFHHADVCGWSMDVTIWDGRRSERKPVMDDPTAPCDGFVAGPDFWFP